MAKHPLAEEFFKEVVQPTVDEYLAQPANIRRGRLAAIVLNHTVDYWCVDTGEEKDSVRQNLEANTRVSGHHGHSFFQIVEDTADASKHARLNRKSRKMTEATQVRQRSVGAFGTTAYNTAPYGGSRAVDVRAMLDDGTVFSLSHAVRKVTQAWHQKLQLP
ncbi:hypothetical protein C4901_11675 [Acidiferrobacter sp. SPIII_3]|uniref:hypothetical protein n=1 Tax=Acidiferrobacter sp. SPIII_3 TaxID=1281578 RepID=UPI000D731AD6|nr:hypothetical protein [Acidiferrobacter sp. SPIII_3]AWP23905.1 hypothetical protein C4901_11675 [Acidiferrobacter sp. SPIII_3]